MATFFFYCPSDFAGFPTSQLSICDILSPFWPKEDIEFLTKPNYLKGINFQKPKVGLEIALPFLFVPFGNHQLSIHPAIS
jgi:hypothetical protein